MTVEISFDEGHKLQTIRIILEALRDAPKSFEPASDNESMEFPSLLPTGDGQHILSNEVIDRQIADYANRIRRNDEDIRICVSQKQLEQITRRSFGSILAKTEFNSITNRKITDIRIDVDSQISETMRHFSRETEFVISTSYLECQEKHDNIVGPVRFEHRDRWLDRLVSEGSIDPINRRRIQKGLKGARLKARLPEQNWKENRIISLIKGRDYVSTVKTFGLSPEVGETKALLVAKLALTVAAMFWAKPSRALDMMRLDSEGGAVRQRVAVFAEGPLTGTRDSVSRLGHGQWVGSHWEKQWINADWLGPIARALTAYVDTRKGDRVPAIDNALFSALWWFREGCIEANPLIATVKLASSMDALARGKKRKGILELIHARMGIEPNQTIFKNDHRTASQIISKIYDENRSRMLHGSHQRIGEDFSEIRESAEILSRLLIILSSRFFVTHPDVVDLDALRQLDPTPQQPKTPESP